LVREMGKMQFAVGFNNGFDANRSHGSRPPTSGMLWRACCLFRSGDPRRSFILWKVSPRTRAKASRLAPGFSSILAAAKRPPTCYGTAQQFEVLASECLRLVGHGHACPASFRSSPLVGEYLG
jgi:hypothetical protein